MSVHIKMTVQKPEDTQITLTITMPLRDWNTLRDKLPSEYPGWRLSDAIADATKRMNSMINVESFDLDK